MTTTKSAREFRANARSTQSTLLQLQLLNSIGFHIANATSHEESKSKILNDICTYSTLEHAVIVLEDAGIYKVKASQGAGLHEGSRIASSIASNIQFKPHESFLVFESSMHRLWPKEQLQIRKEWLFPIRINTNYIGFLALASENESAHLSSDEIEAMQTVCAMLASYFQVRKEPKHLQDMQSVQLLTTREKEVFSLLPLGITNAEIGVKLGITTGTAKLHVERILNKLGLTDRTQAAVKASQMGYSD
jgi:DNA-binding CsgD family transcriptional regulator